MTQADVEPAILERRTGDYSATVSRDLGAAIARIRSRTGQVVGTGFLVDSTHVVTCAHVVAAALGLGDDERPDLDNEVTVDFPLACLGGVVPTVVEVWVPVDRDDRGDIAVLRVVSDAPLGTGPVRIVSSPDFWGHPFRAFGFPRNHDHGVWTSGVLRGRQGAGWVQMEGGTGGYAIESGFSGSLVWDDDLVGVVGMTVAAEARPETRSSYLIPADALLAVWPMLGERLVPPCPYRGLAPFRAQDAATFFGREGLTSRLIAEVGRRSAVALVGPSGSGKSSVLLAGLLPHLEADPEWASVVVRPAAMTSPFLALASGLLALLDPRLSETERLRSARDLAAQIADGHLSDIVQRVLDLTGARRLLIGIDQFEEVFARTDTEVADFTRALFGPADPEAPVGSSLTIVLTLRADFLNDALQDSCLATALRDSILAVGQLARPALHTAIEGPLPADVTYESGLVDRILDDLGQQSGSLPLLQFALTLLWERQHEGVMHHEDYSDLGEVDGALAAYAERMYDDLSPNDQEEARRVFLQLTRPTEVGAPVRRIARPQDLGARGWQLARRLASTRLLVVDREPSGTESIELVHEALITRWDRLRIWIEEDREFRVWQEQLRQSVAAWERVGRDPGALLRGAPLAVAERWLYEREADLGMREAAYLRTAVASRGRSGRRLRAAVVALASLLVGALVLCTVVVAQSHERAQQLRLIGSRDVAASALKLSETDPRTAMLLAASAYQLRPTEEAVEAVTKLGSSMIDIESVQSTGLPAMNQLETSPTESDVVAVSGTDYVGVWNTATRRVLGLHRFPDMVDDMTFLPNGTGVLVQLRDLSDSTRVVVWSLDGDTVAELPRSASAMRRLPLATAVSSDGALMALCTERSIEIWSLRKRNRIADLSRRPSPHCDLGFAHDHGLVVVEGDDIVIRDARQGAVVRRLPILWPASDPYTPDGLDERSMVVAPNGQHLVLATLQRVATVDLPTRKVSTWAPLGEGGAQDRDDMRITSDSMSVVIPDLFSAVVVDLQTLHPVLRLPWRWPSGDPPRFAADRRHLVGLVGSGSLAVVDSRSVSGLAEVVATFALAADEPGGVVALSGEELLRFGIDAPQRANRTSLPVADDIPNLDTAGRYLASTSETSKGVRLWDLTTLPIGPPAVLRGHRAPVSAVAFSGDGSKLATSDGTDILIWATESRRILRRLPLRDRSAALSALALDRKGEHMVSVDVGGRAVAWDVARGSTVQIDEPDVQTAAFGPFGDWLALGASTGLSLWRSTSGDVRLTRRVNSDLAEMISFSADERYVAVGGIAPDDGAKVFSVPDLRLAGVLPPATGVLLLAGQERALVASESGVQLVGFDPREAVTTICRATATANLSPAEWQLAVPNVPYTPSCP